MLVLSLLGPICFLLSSGLTYYLIYKARSWGMLDNPNHRSFHSTPTPKGGGVAFAFACSIGILILFAFNKIRSPIITPLFYGTPIIVALGWLDDRYSLSAKVRLVIHFLVSFFIYGLITQWFTNPVSISFLPKVFWLNAVFCILFISWFINLYNFMDGADGMAGSMAVTASILIAWINFFHGLSSISIIYGILSYSVAGFLIFNWQPARIFMGDTGSYFLGFIFATLALTSKMHTHLSFYSHIIIFSFFIVDTTYTLLMRLVRGEKVSMAHKQHAFHKLTLMGFSHRRVTVLYSLGTVLWLFPIAYTASIYDDYGIPLVILAFLPILAYVVLVRAGTDVLPNFSVIKKRGSS